MKRAVILMFVAACSNSTGSDSAAIASGGAAAQSTSGGDSSAGGVITNGGAGIGGDKTGGSKATGGRATGGIKATGGAPGYPCASIAYTCFCAHGSLVMDMTCPSSKDPANNLCLTDLHTTSPDGGTPGACTPDCTSYCEAQSDRCTSVGTVSC